MCLTSFIKKIMGYEHNINTKDFIEYWVNDPSVNLKLKTQHRDSILPIIVSGYKGGGYPIETAQGRVACCYAIINNCLDTCSDYCSKTWALKKPLNIYPMAGLDLNAYYDRKSIKYFYYFDAVLKKNTYLCESADVVSHELGHAILDTLRPDFWNVQSYEIWALHEFFGDFIAIINILNNEQILRLAIKETGDNLFKSNTISRLAEHFAKTLYNVTKGKTGIDPNSLRDAVNHFSYIDPKHLPEEESNDKLSRECHSFSRVMTGCFYEILIEIYNYEKQTMDNIAAMQLAKNVITKYLFLSIIDVPCTNKIFKTLCKKIIQVDKNFGSRYVDILQKIFNKRNLLIDYENLSIQNFEQSKEKTKKIIVNYKQFKNLYVEVPFENKIEYDKEGKVEIFSYNSLEESVDDAVLCIESLFNSKMIDNSFKIKKNYLFRQKIIN